MKQVKYSHVSDHACANEARAAAVPCCGWTGRCWAGSGSGRGCLSGGGRGGGCLVMLVVVVAPVSQCWGGGGCLVVVVAPVSQWWWSVSLRVFLAKIPFLAFSH